MALSLSFGVELIGQKGGTNKNDTPDVKDKPMPLSVQNEKPKDVIN